MVLGGLVYKVLVLLLCELVIIIGVFDCDKVINVFNLLCLSLVMLVGNMSWCWNFFVIDYWVVCVRVWFKLLFFFLNIMVYFKLLVIFVMYSEGVIINFC